MKLTRWPAHCARRILPLAVCGLLAFVQLTAAAQGAAACGRTFSQSRS